MLAKSKRWFALVALVVLASCSSGGVAKVDPYDVYLANNPDPSHVISREAAQTRALLGCKVEWAPGTVDYVLHQAYKNLC